MSKVIEFRNKVKQQAPPDTRYILITVNVDGSDGSIEHSDGLGEYTVLGIMEWAKSLVLETCKQPGGDRT